MARFCSRCGTPIEPGDTFCSECGYKIPVPTRKRPVETPRHEAAPAPSHVRPSAPARCSSAPTSHENTPVRPSAPVQRPVEPAEYEYLPKRARHAQTKKKKKIGPFILLGVVVVAAILLISCIIGKKPASDEPAPALSSSPAPHTTQATNTEEFNGAESEPTISPITTPDTTATSSINTSASSNEDAYNAYYNILSAHHDGDLYYFSYHLHDIDQDGIDELLVSAGPNPGETVGLIYAYRNGEAKKVGTLSRSFSPIAIFLCEPSGNDNGLIVHYVGENYEITSQISLSGDAITEDVLLEGSIAGYNYTHLQNCIELKGHDISEYDELSETKDSDNEIDDYMSTNVIDIDLGIINSSAKAFLEDYSYLGGNYVTWDTESFGYLFKPENNHVYNLEHTGSEKVYYLHDDEIIITVRDGSIIAYSQSGYLSSDIPSTYALLTWLGIPELLNYEPEIIPHSSRGDAYLKWEANNGYVVINTLFNGTDDWKKSNPGSFCVFIK